MKKVTVFILLLGLFFSLMSPAVVAKKNDVDKGKRLLRVKLKPERGLPKRGLPGRLNEKVPKALGKGKFQLNGVVVGVSAPTFTVKVKAGTKSLRLVFSYKKLRDLRGRELTITTNSDTRIMKKGKQVTLADLKEDDRVHVGGKIEAGPILYAKRVKIVPKESTD